MNPSLFCFRSSLFNATQSRPNWPAPHAYGEDLAEWLRAHLQCEGYALSKPHWTGRAWELECRKGEQLHEMRVCHDVRVGWEVNVVLARSWWASLMLPERAAHPDLREAIHSLFLREPAVRELRWKSGHADERVLSTH